MSARQVAPVWRRREAEEQEGGVEGEGGGEDEGGEGVAFCQSVEGKESASTRADFAPKLIHNDYDTMHQKFRDQCVFKVQFCI